jgi:hypothetical protein
MFLVKAYTQASSFSFDERNIGPDIPYLPRSLSPCFFFSQLTAVHLVDSHYCTDPAKFISVLCTSLATMLHVELPHVNLLSKMDLIEHYGKLGKSSVLGMKEQGSTWSGVKHRSQEAHAWPEATTGPDSCSFTLCHVPDTIVDFGDESSRW